MRWDKAEPTRHYLVEAVETNLRGSCPTRGILFARREKVEEEPGKARRRIRSFSGIWHSRRKPWSERPWVWRIAWESGWWQEVDLKDMGAAESVTTDDGTRRDQFRLARETSLKVWYDGLGWSWEPEYLGEEGL